MKRLAETARDSLIHQEWRIREKDQRKKRDELIARITTFLKEPKREFLFASLNEDGVSPSHPATVGY